MTARARILVVDGKPGARSSLGRALEAEGLEVHTASSAVDALGKVDEVRPDIVLSDTILPEMSGLELWEALRARHGQLVVILMKGRTCAGAAADGATSARATAEITRVVALVALQVEAVERGRTRARPS
jgi:DNA-binding NtrC family response regulator